MTYRNLSEQDRKLKKGSVVGHGVSSDQVHSLIDVHFYTKRIKTRNIVAL